MLGLEPILHSTGRTSHEFPYKCCKCQPLVLNTRSQCGKEYRWHGGNVRMDVLVGVCKRVDGVSRREPSPISSEPREASVTSTTSLMLRTIALAGVHDGKSISFRVSLSGFAARNELRTRTTLNSDVREREERGILCLRAQIT